jgi:hypothetical protein
MDKKFTKLSALIDDEFTVQGYLGYRWKMWDDNLKKMQVSDEFVKGYQKKHQFETDKGLLDLGPGQVGNLLEGILSRDGRAEPIKRTFSVKSNGKTGIDIRYYINPVRKPVEAPKDVVDENIEGYQDLPPDW